MPSQPPEPSWDFRPVLDLIDSDISIASPALLPRHHGSDAKPAIVVSDGPPNSLLTLGTFDKIWQELGTSIEAPTPGLSPSKPDSGNQSNTEDAPISPIALNGNTQNAVDNPDIDTAESPTNAAQAGTNDPYAGLTKNQRHNARKRANKIRKAEELQQKEAEKQEGKRMEQQIQASVEQEPQKKPTAGNLQSPASVRILTRPRANLQTEATEKVEPKQIFARSRSNVGAKIKPASPALTGLPAPVPPSNMAIPTVIDIVPVTSTLIQQPVPTMNHHTLVRSGAYSSVTAHPFVQRNSYNSTDPVTPLPAQHIVHPEMPPALVNLNSTLQTQYNTFGTPIGYQSQLPPGFLTPSSSMMNVPTPGFAPLYTGLVPTSVPQPLASTRKKTKKALARSREELHFDFLKKLMEKFPEEKKWLVSPMRMTSDKMSSEGIHVFVDASNILIGFREMLRRSGSPDCDMSFDCLALLLERRRPMAKRVYAGSTRPSAPIAISEKFNDLAGAVGYEKNIYEQVFKVKELTESQKFFKDVDRMGWVKATKIRSGSSSDSETGAAAPPLPSPAPKWVEQGVDESLHLKMCQSIIDADVPSIMILATGDGAIAEYSDGFLAHVERALRKGWKVELVSWRQQTSSGYKNKSFRAKWGDKFKIIELDEYLEFMIDT